LACTPPRVAGEAPAPGQHSREVYVDWLCMPAERFDSLRARGVI